MSPTFLKRYGPQTDDPFAALAKPPKDQATRTDGHWSALMQPIDLPILTRAEFILSGFSTEAMADGSFLFISRVPGEWQAFESGADMLEWLAAGIGEIKARP